MSIDKTPLFLDPETVKSVEMSENEAQRAATADVRPFHEVARNSHPTPIAAR